MKCELCQGIKPVTFKDSYERDVDVIVRFVPIMDDSWKIAIWHRNSDLIQGYVVEDYLDFHINYCPMCGRKLDEE